MVQCIKCINLDTIWLIMIEKPSTIGTVATLAETQPLRALPQNPLDITQPASDTKGQTLGTNFGVKIFDRTPRRVFPTVFGVLLLKAWRDDLSGGEELIRNLRLMQDWTSGKLTVQPWHFIPAEISGPPCGLGRMMRAHPKIRSELQCVDLASIGNSGRYSRGERTLQLPETSEAEGGATNS